MIIKNDKYILFASPKVKSLWVTSFLLYFILSIKIYGQIPNKNPYSSNQKPHWTDSLMWTNVHNALKIDSLVLNGGIVDSLRLQKVMKSISKLGGGVLYFPGGTYFFDFDLYMEEGVLIRGENPHGEETKRYFKSPTKFIFPKYIPTFKGTGTPNNSAFKGIYGGKNHKKNFGIVNLDINRAIIDFRINKDSTYHDNIIIFGIRQNNAAALDPYIPSKIQIDEKHGWQRWPLWSKEKMSVSVSRNAIISKCRINDSTTENFTMPNYMTNDGYLFKSDTISFRYDLFGGIILYVTKANQIEISNNYVKGPKLANKITVRNKSNVKLLDNILEDIEDEKEMLLIDRKFHYSNPYQNDVKKYFERKILVKNGKDTLVYYLLSPKKSNLNQKYPLIVFFHGSGEIGSENPLIHFVSMFTKDEVRNDFPAYVLVPQLMNINDSWISNIKTSPPAKPLALAIEVVNNLINDKMVDPKRVYVSGVSSGGNAVFESVYRYPNLFASAIVMSCLLNPTVEELKKIKDITFFFTTGAQDDILPVRYMRLMVKRITNANIKLEYKEYQDIGHFSWIPLYNDKSFIPWLFDQRK